MSVIVAREKEQKLLLETWGSEKAEFIALYGRRRVGKTFIVRRLFEKKGIFVQVTGIKDGNMADQLRRFSEGFAEAFYTGAVLQPPANWDEAFKLLNDKLKELPKSKKVTIFLDELPWLSTKKSGLLQSLDVVWNSSWSDMSNVKLIVCGSAASWMLDKLINAKGGLHNRLTTIIKLKPFTLAETKLFLLKQGIHYTNKQILDIYMAVGGIPHYLGQVRKSLSPVQNINNICFQEDGLLYDEFERLFKSLFENSDVSISIIKEIAKHRDGIKSEELVKRLSMSSGGTFVSRLNELVAAGFIERFVPYGRLVRDHYYRIIDEYTMFYLTWIDGIKGSGIQQPKSNYWKNLYKTPMWNSWAGYAFEAVCYKHIDNIIQALQLGEISCQVGSWRYVPEKGSNEKGAQIDLLIDRADDIISLCDFKYSASQFSVDKSVANNIANKVMAFEKHYPTNKQISVALITTLGMKRSIWSEQLIDVVVSLDALFE
jgi:hypothetical protein